MKKTLMINISGIIFHIDEDAYTLLNEYLESIKLHFRNSEGSEEIIHDIECRIGEILQQKLGEARQVVLEEDIREIIRIMGLPGQFDEATTGEEELYIKSSPFKKRFFRDPDSKILGGVCSGISAYFHIDPLWVRLIFVISLFAGGLGILIYLILWVVIPEAKNTAEKLEMRGEQINISSIEDSIRGELSHLKGRIDTLTNGNSHHIKKPIPAGPGPLQLFINGMVTVLKVTLRVILIIFGITFVLTGMAFLIAIVALAFGWGGAIMVDHHDIIPSLPVLAAILLGIKIKFIFLQVTLLLLFGIPALLIVYNGLWMIIRFKRIHHFGLNAFYFWLIGLGLAVFFSLKIANLYRSRDVIKEKIVIDQPKKDTLFISMKANDSQAQYLNSTPFTVFDNIRMVEGENDHLYLMPDIEIIQSQDSLFYISRFSYANGTTTREARERISRISYPVTVQDSLITLPVFVSLPRGEDWRGHEVKVKIYVPVGKWIQLDENTRKLLHYSNYYFYFDDPYSISPAEINTPKTLKMTADGLD